MNVTDKMILEYGIKGYKAMCRADADVLKIKVKYGICKYSSKLEEKIVDRIFRNTETDDDWMLYREKDDSVLVANAQYNDKKWIIGFDVWKLH